MFNGLTMPVFTAFGWAGEETALKFAFSQLQLFAQALHSALPRELQTYFPHYGVDRAAECAYLARNQDVESDLFVTFHTRPMAFRVTVNLVKRPILVQAFKRTQDNPGQFYRIMSALDPEWQLRLQQMEYNAEDDTASHYRDEFKDSVSTLTAESAEELVARADYLNSERERWLAPFYMSRSMSSEAIAAMGSDVVKVMLKMMDELRPAMFMLSQPVGRLTSKQKSSAKSKAKKKVQAVTPTEPAKEAVDQFSYVSVLKPLHIRKGFVNMTPDEWPFFAINARTTTRDVTATFDNQVDSSCAVWRLVPSDQARLMLGGKGRRWLNDHFAKDDQLRLTVTKHADDTIEILLEPVVE